MGIIDEAADAAFAVQKMEEEASKLLARAHEQRQLATENLKLAFKQGRVTRPVVYFDPLDLHPSHGLLDLKVYTEDSIQFIIHSRYYSAVTGLIPGAKADDELFFCYDAVTAKAEVRAEQTEHEFVLVFKDIDSSEETRIPLVESGEE